MTDAATRKRALLLESELNRKVLQLELGQWQLRATRWQSRASKLQTCWNLASLFLPRKVSLAPSLAGAIWKFVMRKRE